MNNIRKIAIYGKGGIGKSTISSNITATLSNLNYHPAQIGCDPKADSVSTLLGGKFIPTISENVQQSGLSENSLISSVYKGFNNIIAMESGGPPPGQGCAGRGVLVALENIEKYRIFEKFNVDFVLFDVLGDIVCGGFAQPIRQGYAQEIYIITSAEYMSLYAANNIAKSIATFASNGIDARAAGIIHNRRNIDNEDIIVTRFADMVGIPLIGHVPRSNLITQSELMGKTVVEAYPDSDVSKIFSVLTQKIINNKDKVIPEIVDRTHILKLLNSFEHSMSARG